MTRYSACIEWLFEAEAPVFADRVRAAKAAGLSGVEFWGADGKDLGAIRAALDETGLPLLGTLIGPQGQLTDPATHTVYLKAVESSLAAALRLGARGMIVATGNDIDSLSRSAQHAALVDLLKNAARIVEGSGVVLMLEPLNDRVDHRGYYLTSTVEGLDIVDEVDRLEVKLVYDIYHSAMMGETTEAVLEGRIDRVAHVHLAKRALFVQGQLERIVAEDQLVQRGRGLHHLVQHRMRACPHGRRDRGWRRRRDRRERSA